MIAARSLTRTFDKVTALRDMSLTIETGEMFALIGPDGAGKTTFFRIVTGLLKPTSGALEITGHSTSGFVPQKFSLYPDLSIDENLALRASLYGLDRWPGLERGRVLAASGSIARHPPRGQPVGGRSELRCVGDADDTCPVMLASPDRRRPMSRRGLDMLNQLHQDG